MLSSLLQTSSPYRYLKSFHTSQISFRFVKDVYKEIQYEAPYRPADKQKVLQVINSAPLKELGHFTSKKMSQTIVNFRKEGGYFDCVEQLLDLEKIEKLCESILSETISNSVANDRTKIMNNIPKLDSVLVGDFERRALNPVWEYYSVPVTQSLRQAINSVPKVEDDSQINISKVAKYRDVFNSSNSDSILEPGPVRQSGD